MFAAKYDRADGHRRQRCPLLGWRVIQSVLATGLGRGLLFSICMGRSRRRGDGQPGANNEDDRSYCAIALSLRLLEPRKKCPESLQGFVSQIFSFLSLRAL